MNVIHEETVGIAPENRPFLDGYTEHNRLSTDDSGGWITYVTARKWENGRFSPDESTFEITSNEKSFEFFLDPNSNDPDSRSASMDIPRERMFEVHAWLTQKLYGNL